MKTLIQLRGRQVNKEHVRKAIGYLITFPYYETTCCKLYDNVNVVWLGDTRYQYGFIRDMRKENAK